MHPAWLLYFENEIGVNMKLKVLRNGLEIILNAMNKAIYEETKYWYHLRGTKQQATKKKKLKEETSGNNSKN